jgi:hypothetical protein
MPIFMAFSKIKISPASYTQLACIDVNARRLIFGKQGFSEIARMALVAFLRGERYSVSILMAMRAGLASTCFAFRCRSAACYQAEGKMPAFEEKHVYHLETLCYRRGHH